MSHVVCHPHSWELLRAMLLADLDRDPYPDIDTLPVLVTDAAPRCFWQLPVDPFVEYEPADEAWCRFFGIGAEDPDRPWFAIVRPAPPAPPPQPEPSLFPGIIHFVGPLGPFSGPCMVQLP